MSRNVIFLDFDGVLRGMIPHRRKKPNVGDLGSFLAEQYQEKAYETIDQSILRNVYYDFAAESCYCVKLLCQIPDTKIVLSTSWRAFYTLETMQKLLELHHIGRYVIDKTPLLYNNRPSEIKEYLKQHPETKQYVIIDDMDLEAYFPGHMLLCKDHLRLSQYQKGYEILSGAPLQFH